MPPSQATATEPPFTCLRRGSIGYYRSSTFWRGRSGIACALISQAPPRLGHPRQKRDHCKTRTSKRKATKGTLQTRKRPRTNWTRVKRGGVESKVGKDASYFNETRTAQLRSGLGNGPPVPRARNKFPVHSNNWTIIASALSAVTAPR